MAFQVMTSHEREMITDLKKCNFNEINDHFKAQSEARKNKSKEEKQVRTNTNTVKPGGCGVEGGARKNKSKEEKQV